ncbi:synaptotagmin-1 isoform X5 [Apis cerana]|uniref:synaptotagmin-1 isoform X5 n=1 Tax=Apis cerana TaxID=7461 RepID=UPI002B22BD69|nr:synaptotagmin-1 isoform X5 [Apis cerana]
MVDDELFGPWGRILIIVVIALIVIVILLVIACYLIPGCHGYEYIRKRKRETKSVPLCLKGKQNENVKLNDVSYRSWRLGSLYEGSSNGTIDENASPNENSYNSSNAQFGFTDTSSTLNLVQKDKQKSEKKQKEFPTELTISLQYLPPCDETITGKLVIGVEEWILDFMAYDHDRYANDTELCSLKVSMKEVKHVLQSPEIHMFNFRMKPSNLEFGNILLGISYLPTAQRLAINVMKVRDVKFTPPASSLNNFNFYVRILMLNGRTGHRIRKKKTKSVIANSQTEFNETLTFDVLYNQLDIVQFLIVLCSKAAPLDIVTSIMDHPSDSEDSLTSIQKSNNIYVGKVALGKGVRGSTERLHWFSILQNPRKLVTVWHVLK